MTSSDSQNRAKGGYRKGQIQGVKYDRIGVVLINAVKEQQTQIESQQKQIEQQRKQIESLHIFFSGVLGAAG